VGTAEDIPLADASVDAIIVAQAWHWVDQDAALRRIDDCVNAPRHARRDRDSDASRFRCDAQFAPVIAAVRRFEQSAAWTVGGGINAPRRSSRLPQRRVDDVRIARLESDINRARVAVFSQNRRRRVRFQIARRPASWACCRE